MVRFSPGWLPPLALIGAWFGAGPGFCCSCVVRPLADRIRLAPVIFLGRVLPEEAEQRPSPLLPVARLEVLELFRGLPQDTRRIEIDLRFGAGAAALCMPSPYTPGRELLVFITRDEKTRRLVDGSCTMTGAVNPDTRAELTELRRRFPPRR